MKTMKQRLQENEFLLGTWAQIASPEVVEIIGYNGFDFVIIDAEHGFFGFETIEVMIRAANVTGIHPIVRVPGCEPIYIQKALDMGAEGVLVPRIRTTDDARKAARAARFHPQGERGACPRVRSGGHQVRNWSTYAQDQNENILVMLLIEEEEAVHQIDEILAVEGIDVIGIGPFDLSVSLGFEGDVTHPRVVDLYTQVIEKSVQKGIQVLGASFYSELEQIRIQFHDFKEKGVNLATIMSDKGVLSHAFQGITSYMKPLIREEQ